MKKYIVRVRIEADNLEAAKKMIQDQLNYGRYGKVIGGFAENPEF